MKDKQQPNSFLKYSGLGLQLFGSIGLAAWIGLKLDQFFELEDKSALHVSMNSGRYRLTEEDALIWQTAVIKNDKFEKDSLLRWVENAHSITSDLFREMTRQHFYDSFK